MKYSCLFVLTTSALMLSACSHTPQHATAQPVTEAPAVAVVNGKAISEQEFAVFTKLALRTDMAQLTAEQRNQILDRLIKLHLAASEAEKLQLQNDPETVATLDLLRANFLSETMLKKHSAGLEISETELKAEYDSKVAGLPNEYHVRHILLTDKAKAEALIAKLKKGADFAALAKKNSKDSGSAEKGGDLDWFRLDAMENAFSAAVVTLEQGQYTQAPVETSYGFHIIKLEGVRAPEVPEFAAVKEQIRNILVAQQGEKYLNELRTTAIVEIKAPPADDNATEATEASPPQPSGSAD